MSAHALLLFVDVLGYRNHIDADKKNGVEKFKDHLITATASLAALNQVEFQSQVISDTILLHTQNRHKLPELLEHAKTIFVDFLQEGLMVRGAIAFGIHYFNNNITYSHVISSAYALESRAAFYPRILIDKNVKEMYETNNEWDQVIASGLVCFDGIDYFLNILDDANKDRVYQVAKELYFHDRPQFSDFSLRAKHFYFQEYLVQVGGYSEYFDPIVVLG